ncbi:hypothetical protein U1701_17175 [Sphingomonas sp. PB2P19]|uniref:hypothetical protein n=1 Tax=Sphingomonas rhamnosi TaxID=3096156 RepID=UPI002FC70A38
MGELAGSVRMPFADRVDKRSRAWDTATIAVTVFATLYFGILALLNAHLFPVSYAIVAGAEGLILIGAVVIIAQARLRDGDALPLILLFAFTLLSVWVSLINDMIYPDPLRNMAIIALFTLLGLRVSPTVSDRVFAIISIVTLIFLAIEVVSTDLYVAILKPASFYQNFRGYQVKEWDESGLFGNARSFASRWSFGLVSHRTSSIFTEQVSLANFAGVLTVMVLTRWAMLSRHLRLLHVVTIVGILLTNSSRTSTMLAVASVAAYPLYPRLPRYGTLAFVPLVMVSAFGLIAVTGLSQTDDLVGRVSITVQALERSDLAFWLGAEIARAASFLDTGYGYLIASTSLVGLILFWLYVSMIVPQRDAIQKRCAYSLALYVFGNLLIGGTAIFAMKVAAPLWLLVGTTARRSDYS